jgi:hypothetical protein
MKAIRREYDRLSTYEEHLPLPIVLRAIVLQYEDRGMWEIPPRLVNRWFTKVAVKGFPRLPKFTVGDDIDAIYDVAIVMYDALYPGKGAKDEEPLVVVYGRRKQKCGVWAYVPLRPRYKFLDRTHAEIQNCNDIIPWAFGAQKRVSRAASADPDAP